MNILNEKNVSGLCLVQKNWPGDRTDSLTWFKLTYHCWNSGVILGLCPSVDANTAVEMEMWCAGKDLAEALANGARFVQSRGHNIVQIDVSL